MRITTPLGIQPPHKVKNDMKHHDYNASFVEFSSWHKTFIQFRSFNREFTNSLPPNMCKAWR